MLQRSGRLQSILTTSAPFIIVVPSKESSRTLSAALQIAHDLDLYHRLDSEIIDDEEAMSRLDANGLGTGNIILLGAPRFLELNLKQRKTSFTLLDNQLHLRGHSLAEPCVASLFLHPHPTTQNSLMLVVYTIDDNALEKAIRLFPIRTGVSIPDWIVVGPNSDSIGAGDVRGAG